MSIQEVVQFLADRILSSTEWQLLLNGNFAPISAVEISFSAS